MLCTMPVVTFTTGVVSPFFWANSSFVELLSGLLIAFLVVIWCVYDATEREVRLGVKLKLVVFLLLVVGLPVYLLKSRGVGGFAALFAAVVMAVFVILIQLLGEHVGLLLGEQLGYWDYVSCCFPPSDVRWS